MILSATSGVFSGGSKRVSSTRQVSRCLRYALRTGVFKGEGSHELLLGSQGVSYCMVTPVAPQEKWKSHRGFQEFWSHLTEQLRLPKQKLQVERMGLDLKLKTMINPMVFQLIQNWLVVSNRRARCASTQRGRIQSVTRVVVSNIWIFQRRIGMMNKCDRDCSSVFFFFTTNQSR